MVLKHIPVFILSTLSLCVCDRGDSSDSPVSSSSVLSAFCPSPSFRFPALSIYNRHCGEGQTVHAPLRVVLHVLCLLAVVDRFGVGLRTVKVIVLYVAVKAHRSSMPTQTLGSSPESFRGLVLFIISLPFLHLLMISETSHTL